MISGGDVLHAEHNAALDAISINQDIGGTEYEYSQDVKNAMSASRAEVKCSNWVQVPLELLNLAMTNLPRQHVLQNQPKHICWMLSKKSLLRQTWMWDGRRGAIYPMMTTM